MSPLSSFGKLIIIPIAISIILSAIAILILNLIGRK